MAYEVIIKIGDRYFAKRAARPYYALVRNKFNATKYDWFDRFSGVSDAKWCGFKDNEIEIIEYSWLQKEPAVKEDFVYIPKRMSLAEFEKTLDDLSSFLREEKKTYREVFGFIEKFLDYYEGNRFDRLKDFWDDGTEWLKSTLEIEEIPDDEILESLLGDYQKKADEIGKRRIVAFGAFCEILPKMKRHSITATRETLNELIK